MSLERSFYFLKLGFSFLHEHDDIPFYTVHVRAIRNIVFHVEIIYSYMEQVTLQTNQTEVLSNPLQEIHPMAAGAGGA
jgi:hypothetical protein